MKENVGKTDKIIRFIFAILFIVASILWTLWLLIPAAILTATALMGTCGLYSLFGINTCKTCKDYNEE
ncbi:MAG: YgaP family membrane protein [bacterium]